MKELVRAQELIEMLGHAIPQQVVSIDSGLELMKYTAGIYGRIARFGFDALSVQDGKPVLKGNPNKTPESFRKDMLDLQQLIIEASNVGFVGLARECASDIGILEREWGELYLQTQEIQR